MYSSKFWSAIICIKISYLIKMSQKIQPSGRISDKGTFIKADGPTY